MTKRWTKKMVQQWCDERGIELHIDDTPLAYHVHLNIDAPRKIFGALGTHNAGVWDSFTQRPDWNYIGRELDELEFTDCTEPDCEVCSEDEEYWKATTDARKAEARRRQP